MIRFFYRLPNLVQFLTFMSLILIAGLLLAWRMLITVVNNQALHSAQDAADFVEAIGDVASSYNGIWVHYNPKKVVKIGDFLDHKDLRPLGAGEASASAPAPTSKHAAKSEVDVIPIKAVGYPSSPEPQGDDPKADMTDLSNLYSSQAVNFNTVGLSRQEIENLVRFGGYMRKNPALFQREVSDAVERGRMRVRFRLTSDKPHNQNNTPNRFELTAMEALRAKEGKTATEYWEIKDGKLLYARSLTAKAACMSCHDTEAKAPAVMQAKYRGSKGYGYVEGDVAGLTSVTVPIENNLAVDMFKTMDMLSWLVFGTLSTVLLLSIAWFVSMTRSARAMSRYMHQVLHSKPGQKIERFALDRDEESSRNEFHRVSMGIKALHRALRLAQSSQD